MLHNFQSTWVHPWLANATNTTDVVYIDFNRAFDSIVFSELSLKLPTNY